MMRWWWADDELMMCWWWADDELVMSWWWTDDVLVMNWWWIGDEQNGLEQFGTIKPKCRIGLDGLDGLDGISLNSLTTRSPYGDKNACNTQSWYDCAVAELCKIQNIMSKLQIEGAASTSTSEQLLGFIFPWSLIGQYINLVLCFSQKLQRRCQLKSSIHHP